MVPTPPLTMVILAAGRSTRYGSLKQLDPMGPGGETLMEYAIHDGLAANRAALRLHPRSNHGDRLPSPHRLRLH